MQGLMVSHYSMLIQWSKEDGAYVVSFPEFPSSHTHGATYEECESRPEHFDNRLLRALRDAGCDTVKIGVESQIQRS